MIFNSDSAKRNNCAKVSTVTGNLRFSYKIKRLFWTPIFDWHVFVLCSFAGSSFPFFTILAVKFNGRIPFRIQFSTWRGSSPSIWRIFMVALKSGQSSRVQKNCEIIFHSKLLLFETKSLRYFEKTDILWLISICYDTRVASNLQAFDNYTFLRHLATMKQKSF